MVFCALNRIFATRMAGIYIHIPFCRSRCIYCGFYSTTGLELRQRYIDAVCQEVELRIKDDDAPKDIKTIYMGGGTPSQLSMNQFHQLFDVLYKYNKVSEEAEVTIEVNPDDVTEAFAEGLRMLPVNRVSMGAQTFDDERLRFLHRRHTAAQVGEAVQRLRAVGIRNISIDLMYGFPNETLSDWEQDIDSALALDVEHISGYCLMIEEGTPLYELRNNNLELRDTFADEELERAMYERLIDKLEAAGFEHYEISNFARQGCRSRHNSSYWTGIPYLGLGAAAHSYDGKSRSWNVADIQQYIEGIERGERIFESETLDADTRYNDMVTVTLRTREGLDLAKLSDNYRDYCLKNASRFLEDGLLRLSAEHLTLTRKGLFVSDMILAELMKIEN